MATYEVPSLVFTSAEQIKEKGNQSTVALTVLISNPYFSLILCRRLSSYPGGRIPVHVSSSSSSPHGQEAQPLRARGLDIPRPSPTSAIVSSKLFRLFFIILSLISKPSSSRLL